MRLNSLRIHPMRAPQREMWVIFRVSCGNNECTAKIVADGRLKGHRQKNRTRHNKWNKFDTYRLSQQNSSSTLSDIGDPDIAAMSIE